MQINSALLDDLARLGGAAAASALDLKREIEAVIAAQLDKLLSKQGLVGREEFEAVREMAAKSREENENIKKKLAELEARLG